MSKDIKKALEHCVEWNCGNCPNRDDLGSGETVCRGRLLPQVLEYVADLEAKLEESESKAELYKQAEKKAIHIYSDEFVEKDKELKELRYKVDKANQDKISFAAEQLNKTRNFVICQEIFSKYKCESKVCRDILQAIDNQINELKGE